MSQRRDDEVRTMDLRLFLDIMRRRAWQIVGVTAVVVVLAVALLSLSSSTYTSTAVVYVQALTLQDVQTDAGNPTVNLANEAALVTNEQQIAEDAAGALKIEATTENLDRLVDRISVSTEGTALLNISCTTGSAGRAQACAQAFADAYAANRLDDASRVASGLTGPDMNDEAASVIRDASLPTDSNKSYPLVVVIAGLIGLLLGIGIALLRERLAEPVTDRETFADALVAPVLAVVPDASRRIEQPAAVSLSRPGSTPSEAYRIARTTLQHVASSGRMKVFAVAGLDGGADATKTTAELAIALAQGGRTVAAVSANLRKPALNRLLGVGSSIGLASVLTGEADLDEALIQTSTPGLSVIASGLTSDLPPELLDTDQMRAVVKELRSSFDFLLLDTAPQPWAADTLSLVPLTDGVIVTAVSGRTLRDDVARLRALVEGVGGQIAGGILKERPSRWHRGGAARASARANAARTRDTGVLRPADESYEDGDGMADAAAG